MIEAKSTRARFFEPMLLLATNSLPDCDEWEYELKLDGYRAIGFTSGGKVHLRSRNNKDFAPRYPAIAEGLQQLPDETVIDGEIVALDDSGRPVLQHAPKLWIINCADRLLHIRPTNTRRPGLES